MNGVVLLDDEQQRALSRRSVHINQQTIFSNSGSSRRRLQSDAQTTISNASTDPRSIATLGAGSGRGEPSIADMSGSPRTNFTSREGVSSRRIPPPIDTQSIHEEGAADPWMYDDVQELDGSWRGIKESQDMSMKLVLGAIVAGFIIGIILQAVNVSPAVTAWIGMPCQLFLRALSCVVVPYVFCSVAVAIGDIVYVGKISIVGYQTARIFVTFWLASTVLGMSIALLVRPLFHEPVILVRRPNSIAFNCVNQHLMTTLTNGSLACMTDPNATTAGFPATTTFVVTDVASSFSTRLANDAGTEQTLDEMLRNVILYVVTSNVLTSFIKSELLPIIVAAMVLGSIAGRSYFNKTRRVNYLYLTLLQLRDTFFLMMEWTIALTPVALVSFIAALMSTTISVFTETNIVYYVLAFLCAGVVQMFILLPVIVFFMTQCNPFSHMKQMTRAYLFAFACSSSVATMPVSLACLRRARTCSQSLSNFVVSIGASSNTSAMGIYVPLAVMYMAEVTGDDLSLTPLRFVALFVLSLVACAATPPVPGAGLAVVTAIYMALFGESEMPPSFMSLVAVDFIVDRIATVCNVHDDLMALKIIAENTDETVVQEHLGERL